MSITKSGLIRSLTFLIALATVGGCQRSVAPVSMGSPTLNPTTGGISCPTKSYPVQVVGLEVDAEANPLGIDVAKPRFFCRMESTARCIAQTAYEIKVGLAPGRSDVWSSGKIVTSTPWVDYGGVALSSRTRYYWSVRVYDQGGSAIDSAQAQFETGVMNENEWSADWISRPITIGEVLPPALCMVLATAGQDVRNNARCSPPDPLLRTTFKIAKSVASARIYASGLGYGMYYVNGNRVDDLELSPGFTDYDKRVFYTVHDVTKLLHSGSNALGAALGRGFYSITSNDVVHGYGTATWHDEPKLRLELHIQYTDGTHDVVRSGPEWKVVTGPILYDDIFGGETFDGTRSAELAGWESETYDDSGWAQAQVASAPSGMLMRQSSEPERVIEKRTFKSVKEVLPGRFVFDLGQNVPGRVNLRVKGKLGDAVTMLHGEMLNADGTVVPPASHGMAPIVLAAAQTDIYKLMGSGKTEMYSPQFQYHGFQYVEVSGWPAGSAPTLDDLTAEVIHTDMKPNGQFSASIPVLNRIVNNCRWAVRLNAHAMPSDTVIYEKTGWTGDGQINMHTWLWLYDIHRYYAKWSRDLQDGQAYTGELPEWAPATPTLPSRFFIPDTTGSPLFFAYSPGWDAALMTVPSDLRLYYGDERPAADRYGAMKLYDQYIASFAPGGVLPYPVADNGIGIGGLGDWSTVSGAPFSAWGDSNAWWYQMLILTAQTAERLGKSDEAAQYRAQANDLRTNFNAIFFDKSSGTYIDPSEQIKVYSQHLNATALEMGLVPSELRQTVADHLADDVVARDYHLNTGMVGTRFLWPALSHNGHADVAVKTASGDTYPSYGYLIDKIGITALAEIWEATARSYSHHFLGTIIGWFFEELAGMQPAEDGFSTIRFAPVIVGDLKWVSASSDTPRGGIVSCWQKSDTGFALDVTIPANAQGIVSLPWSDATSVYETGTGTRYPVSNAPGVVAMGAEGSRQVYRVGSGHYAFRAGDAVSSLDNCGKAVGTSSKASGSS